MADTSLIFGTRGTRPSEDLPSDDAPFFELAHDGFHGLGDAELVGVEFELGFERGFVGGGDAGEVADFMGAGFPVEAFGVPGLADGERGVHIDLIEMAIAHVADEVAVAAVRRNKGGDADEAGLRKEGGDFADAPDVFLAVAGGKAEVAAEAVADAVAIQDEGVEAAGEEGGFEFVGDAGFAGGGEAGEPQHTAAMAITRFAIVDGDFAIG